MGWNAVKPESMCDVRRDKNATWKISLYHQTIKKVTIISELLHNDLVFLMKSHTLAAMRDIILPTEFNEEQNIEFNLNIHLNVYQKIKNIKNNIVTDMILQIRYLDT